MSETWFTADTHFGHKKIIEYEKDHRPFNNVDEMNEALISRWNAVVKPGDTVYHLGDVAFGERNVRLCGSLNGTKKLIMGNHDQYPCTLYLQYFDKLYGVIFWEQCILSHVPVHTNGLGSRWFLNVHGHLHSNVVFTTDRRQRDIDGFQIPDPNYLCVSVEQNNLTPISADIIRDLVALIKG